MWPPLARPRWFSTAKMTTMCPSPKRSNSSSGSRTSEPKRFLCAIPAKVTASARSSTSSIPSTAPSPGTKNISPSPAPRASPTFSPSHKPFKIKKPRSRGFFTNVYEFETRCLSLCFATRRCRRSHFLAVRALDTCSLALQIAQVIQPRPANFAPANYLNRADRRRLQREDALNAHPKAHAPHRKGGAGGPALLRNHHALKGLQALFHLFAFAFLEPYVHAHRIARAKLGEVFAQLRFM